MIFSCNPKGEIFSAWVPRFHFLRHHDNFGGVGGVVVHGGVDVNVIFECGKSFETETYC